MLLRLAGLCAGSEQCSADIRGKILKAGFTPGDADGMLKYLVGHGYIDDTRFARAFAADKVRFAGWGKIKIRMALKMKGISDTLVSEALAYVGSEDYEAALWKALVAKARALDMDDLAERRKLFRHLASRGFEADLIVKATRGYMKKLSESRP